MKNLYCAECGKPLAIVRKALPKLATIVDVAEPHTCSEEPAGYSAPLDMPKFVNDPNSYKFVKLLNGLEPSKERVVPFNPQPEQKPGPIHPRSSMVGTDDLRDRRFDAEEPKSTAPPSVLDMIKNMENSKPANEPPDLESEEPTHD